MINIKENAIEAIKSLPEDTSLEEILYTIYIKTKAINGMQDIKKGNFITQEELLEEVSKWK